MKKTLLVIIVGLLLCASVFAVTYEEGKTLDVYPDAILSGNRFAIQFDPRKKSAYILHNESAKTMMIMQGSVTLI